MNCNECRTALQTWLTSALENPEHAAGPPTEVEEHARTCSDCRRRLDTALLLVEPGGLWPAPSDDLADRAKARLREHRDTRNRGRPGRVLRPRSSSFPGRGVARFAAAAAVIVVAVVSGLLVGRGLPNRAPAEVAADAGAGDIIRVEFHLEAPDAQAVAVVGDWNGWDAVAHPLTDDDGDGIWTTTVTLRPDREYQYQFLIDDRKWIPDPSTPLTVDDGFGGTNSVLDI